MDEWRTALKRRTMECDVTDAITGCSGAEGVTTWGRKRTSAGEERKKFRELQQKRHSPQTSNTITGENIAKQWLSKYWLLAFEWRRLFESVWYSRHIHNSRGDLSKATSTNDVIVLRTCRDFDANGAQHDRATRTNFCAVLFISRFGWVLNLSSSPKLV